MSFSVHVKEMVILMRKECGGTFRRGRLAVGREETDVYSKAVQGRCWDGFQQWLWRKKRRGIPDG